MDNVTKQTKYLDIFTEHGIHVSAHGRRTAFAGEADIKLPDLTQVMLFWAAPCRG